MKYVLSQLKKLFIKYLSVILFFAIWEIAPRTGLLDIAIISPPSMVFASIGKLLQTGELATHVAISLQRALLGFALAALVAVPLGFLLGGGFKFFERLLLPILHLFEKVNPFALFPVFILLFGIGEFSKVAIIFWVCQWPILFQTITAVRNVDPLLLKTAKSMGADRKLIFLKVIFPSALPGIFTGVKISSQVAFFMIIAAEMVGATKGLGWLVYTAQATYQMPVLFAGTLVIAVLGIGITFLFEIAEHRITGWKQSAFGKEA